jgi:hypothetical protein
LVSLEIVLKARAAANFRQAAKTWLRGHPRLSCWINVFLVEAGGTWMAGASPAMTPHFYQ